MMIHPRKREDVVMTGWKIAKDNEPGPASYNNEPVKVKNPRQVWSKEKKVTYMEKHMHFKKPIPAPGFYKGTEKAVD